MVRTYCITACLIAWIASVGAAQEAPKEKPYLVLNSGGHTDDSQVLFTRDGREVISISFDRTIRIWDAVSGTSLRTLRPPIGPGNLGMLYAAALSPDGDTLAVASHGANSKEIGIFLIGLTEGQIRQVLRGHTSNVMCLAFDSRGERLASGSHDKTARVWDLKTGAAVRVLTGHTKSIQGVAFSPQSDRLLTASDDETARIWDLGAGATLHTLRGHTSKLGGCDWSRDGKRLATGGHDQSIILWDSDGKKVFSFDKLLGEILNVRFIAGDREILFTSRGGVGKKTRAACLDLYKTGQVRAEHTHNNAVFGADVSPDGRWVVSSGGNDSEIYVWRAADGKRISQLTGQGKATWAAAWHPSGGIVAWGNDSRGSTQEATQRLEHTFSLETLERGGAPDQSYTGRLAPLGSSTLTIKGPVGKYSVHVTRGNEEVVLEGFPRPDSYEMARSGTLAPDRYAAIGADYGLYLYDITTGKHVRSFIANASAVYSVAVSPNGRYLLSASNDQTLRVWALEKTERMAIAMGLTTRVTEEGLVVLAVQPESPASRDGRWKVGDIIVALAPEGAGEYMPATNESLAKSKTVFANLKVKVKREKEDNLLEFVTKREWLTYFEYRNEPLLSLFFTAAEWIAWTPEGYYAASPGGEHLMGWHVNNASDKMASYHPAAQFRKSLYRPDVIKLLLKTGSVDRAVEIADLARGKRSPRADVAAVLPPKVRFLSPDRALAVRDPALEVRARASSVGDHPVTALHLYLDGRPLPAGTFRVASPKLGDVDALWTVVVPPGKHRLAVRAESAVSNAHSEEIEVSYAAPDPAEGVKLPTLYVLSIGISDYPGDLKLNYAAKDAQAVGKAFQDHSKPLFDKIVVKELTNKSATQREMMLAIAWLKKQPTQRDVAVLFFAGHGDLASDGTMYLMPADIERDNLEATGLSGDHIKTLLTSMPCRVILMLDACHAGGLDNKTKKRGAKSLTDELIRDLVSDERGVIALCASTGRQFALESNQYGHGLFTLALVEGLQGKGAKTSEGAVYLHHLDSYVTERVKELSQGQQSPTTARPTSVRSFPLSRP
jgi:WD40 repeat protein